MYFFPLSMFICCADSSSHYYSHFSVYFGLCMCSSNTISDNSLPMISIFCSMCGILFTHFLSMLNIRLCVLFFIVGAFVKANIP